MVSLVEGRPVTRMVARARVTNRLPPGRHRFSLVVIDAAGNRSEPDFVTVEVLADPAPISASSTPS